jgi:moderate conductance mechanosensitive channel
MLLDVNLSKWLAELGPISAMLVRLAITLVAAWLVQRIGFLLVRRSERWVVRSAEGEARAVQRAHTLGQSARHLVTTLVVLGAFFYGLEVLGLDLRPLLVGAGILGAGLAFGAQTLVRDHISGVFILVDDQFSVGDSVEVNGQAATVEAVNLRSTRLRDWQGRLLFVPNGEMRIVVNHSRGGWYLAVVDLPIAVNQDLGSVLDVAAGVASEVNGHPELNQLLQQPMKVMGIERLGPDGAIVRLAGRSLPGAPGFELARQARRIALARLREAGIRVVGDPDLKYSSQPTPYAGPDARP